MFLPTLMSDKASSEQLADLEAGGELRWDLGLPDKQDWVCCPSVLLQCPADAWLLRGKVQRCPVTAQLSTD